MFILALIITLQNVFIGGHMVKSDMIDGILDIVHRGENSVTAEEHLHIESYSNTNSDDNSLASELYKSLAFYPPMLNFGSAPIGSPKSQMVMLVNKNTNRSVYLSSISGKTATFYSSFFEDKIVPPQGNTTFNVVFLPRTYDRVQTSLLIHTSFGQAKLLVKGQGKECPYRLKPLVGIKSPFNATLRPEILMYNPHSKPIQILEVYSSGGQFQLELPSGGQEGPQALWEIPPLSTKPVIRIKFHAIAPGNHTAYIRIKISSKNDSTKLAVFGNTTSESQEDIKKTIIVEDNHILVVPVEIEVYENHGIYSSNPVIDFGRITTTEEIKSIKLNLTDSTGKQSFKIIDYQLKNVNSLIKIDKNNLNLTINAKSAKANCIINGELILQQTVDNVEESNNLLNISVPIRAEIFKGSLEFNSSSTIFITGYKNFTKTKRFFWIENKFDVPINIINYAVEVNETNVYNITDLYKLPTTIHPSQKIDLFSISIINETSILNSFLRISTNLTIYEIPFIIASGKLQMHTSFDQESLISLPDATTLDFGTVPYGDYSHSGFILLKNLNPFPIPILEWNIIAPTGVNYHSTFWGCLRKGLFNDITKISDEIEIRSKSIQREEFTMCQNISSNNMAVFRLGVQSFNVKAFSALFKIWTEFEEIVTNVKFVTVMGRLEIDQSKLHFSDCFPGKRCSADISIHSTFLKTMGVNAITVNVPGLDFDEPSFPNITANTITNLGRIYFDPKAVCAQNCYIPYETLNFDESELRRRTELFRRFKWNLQQIIFKLNTSEVRLFEFKSTVDIVWPKLVNGIQTLPTVEVGQVYNAKIRINNPSDQLLVAEINLSDPRKAKATRLSLPLEVVEICVHCYLTDQDVFHLDDRKLHIEPNHYLDVDIRFSPMDPGVFSTLLHIRNNLTLYEAVWITTKSVQPQFRFGNRKPGSLTPLLFEINEKHLSSCEKAAQNKNKKFPENDHSDEYDDIIVMVSTKRTFTARNTGEVPIWIENFQIGDKICEGYGFKILDCTSFELKANSSKKIDIAFTPDFTSARITLPLILKTNLSYSVNYTLVATIPSGSLEQCSKMLQRPSWEYHMQKMSIVSLVVALIFVLIAAFFESDKILKDHVNNMAKDKGPVLPALDLRNIALRCNTEKEDINVSADGNNTIVSDKHQTFSGNGKVNANLKKRSSKKVGNGSAYSSSVIRDKTWAEELVKNFSPSVVAKKSDDHTNYNVKSSTEKYASCAISNLTRSKEPVSEKITPPKNAKLKESPPDQKPKENKKFIETIEKKQTSDSYAESKRSRFALKKTKSAPLPASNDSSSNTSGSPVNPYKCDIESKSKPKLPKEKLPDVVKQTEMSFFNKSGSSTTNISDNEDLLGSTEINCLNDSKTNDTVGKKYGKTPGRERKKDNEKSSKRSERKVPKFKGNAFQFTLPITSSGNSSTNHSNKSSNDISLLNNVWSSNQASFSHVVAQNGRSSPYLENNQLLNANDIKCDFDGKTPEESFIFGSSIFNDFSEWNEADLKNHETFGCDQNEENKRNSVDLGPIGTRKSPSSTPTVWEPLQQAILENPKPNLSNINTSNMNNTSFFSNNFSNGNNFDCLGTNTFGGDTTELLNLLSSNRWPTDEIFLTLLQQQQQIKLQANNWALEDNRRWTPMGYQSERNNLSAIWQQEQQTQSNQSQSVGASRPPPGLSLPKRDSPSCQIEKQLQHQQQIQQFLMQQHQQQQHQQQQSKQQIHSQAAMSNLSNISNPQNFQQTSQNLLHQQLQQNHQQQQNHQHLLQQQQSMQPFDPFRSWNSVWSNTFNKNNDANKQ